MMRLTPEEASSAQLLIIGLPALSIEQATSVEKRSGGWCAFSVAVTSRRNGTESCASAGVLCAVSRSMLNPVSPSLAVATANRSLATLAGLAKRCRADCRESSSPSHSSIFTPSGTSSFRARLPEALTAPVMVPPMPPLFRQLKLPPRGAEWFVSQVATPESAPGRHGAEHGGLPKRFPGTHRSS